MKSWPAALHRKWFAVARADRVGKKPVAVTLLNRPIVLVRLDGEHVVGFEDRCPHRQAPLSAGRVVQGALQCPYHGWKFDPSGTLVELPGMPEGGCLPGIRARTIEVVEHDGLVWARLEGGDDAGIPRLVQSLVSGSRRFLWQARWQAGAVDILENVLDPMHTHFVHRGLIRFATARRDIVACCSSTAEGFSVDYAGNEQQSGLIYRLFESPREFERAHFAEPGSVQLEYGYRNGSCARISLHVSPESDSRSQVFGTLHIDGRWAPAWAVRLFVWPFIRKVARQDAHILALQTANARRFPERRDAITPYDIVRRRVLAVWDVDSPDMPESIPDRETVMRL
jgi:phenylpropionate dioxygenase-like ring-hydroxylating dioxygenase large terminal subunit